MAVTYQGQDVSGKLLDNEISTLTTLQTNAVAGSAFATMLNDKIRDAQLRAVQHYLQVGRLTPAAILAAAL
jgi:hypothetical protein